MKKTKQHTAYLTVFLSMILMCILSLVLVLVDGARRNGVRQIAEVVTDTGITSCLGEYHRELMRRYDLFAIDTSYGTASGGIEKTTEHLRTYLETNLTPKGYGVLTADTFCGTTLDDVQITGYRTLYDQGGLPLREQISAYMTSEAVTGKALAVTNLTGKLREKGWAEKTPDAFDKYMEDAKKNLKNKDPKGEPKDGYTDVDGDGYTDAVDISAGNPFEAIDKTLAKPVLVQIFGSEAGLSAKSITDPFCDRTVTPGTGAAATNTHEYTPAGSLMMVLYLDEKCGDYRSPSTGALSYEKEYILCGKNSDRVNLAAVCTRLLAIREAANLAYFVSSSKRMQEAKAAAGLLSAIILNPGLEPLFEAAVAVIWCYLESVNDVKTLVKGNKVPFMKTDETFQMQVTNVGNIANAGEKTDGTKEGQTYEDYLNAFLYVQDLASPTVTNERLLSVIEKNIRKTAGNGDFNIENLVDTIEITCDFSGRGGASCSVSRTAGYD